jgi:hypothetical protein
MKSDAQLVCNSCLLCAKYNLPRRSFHNGLHSITATQPFKIVGADIVGPLPPSDSGYQYFILFVDYFSNYVVAECIDKIDAKTLAAVFRSGWLDRFETPAMFICDGGSQFLSEEFRRFLARKKIQFEPTTFYHQQANGKAERTIQTIKKMMAKQLDQGEFQADWDIQLPAAVERYNHAIQVETKFTPAQLALNEEPTAIVDFSLADPMPLPHQDKIIQAQANIERTQKRQKSNFDRRHREWEVRIRDSVMVKKKLFAGENKSLAEQYYGPFKVRTVLEHDTFVLDGFPSAVSIDRLKPFTQPEEAIEALEAPRRIATGKQARGNLPTTDGKSDDEFVVDDIVMIKPVNV